MHTPKRLNSVSAFFPAYNDGGTIPSMIITAVLTLAKVTDDYEVVVVNDGSADYTAEVLAELTRLYPRHVRIITHPNNRGYGAALRSGFTSCTKEWVFYTDGDAQYDPHQLVDLVEALQPGVDIVNGYKIVRHDPLHRVIIGRLYHYIVKIAFGFTLRDVDCDFRLIRREIFDNVPLESDTGTIALELVKKFQDKGYRFAEVPVHHFHRAYGKSQFFNFPRLWRTGIHLVQLWWKLVVKKEHLQ